jgi:hypothetical protein
MPNLSRALTARKLGTGERRPALIHPCVRLHLARNLGTQATLHDYHLEGDEVNAMYSSSRLVTLCLSVVSFPLAYEF